MEKMGLVDWEARVSVVLVALKFGNFERTLSSYTASMQWDGESCSLSKQASGHGATNVGESAKRPQTSMEGDATG